MLVSFLERGNTLHSLSRSQLYEIECAFTLYLIKAITFREAMKMCDNVLDEDQEDMHRVIKVKLSEIIEDADCNCKFKPAILRLANGDAYGFKVLGASTTRTQTIINRHKKLFKQQLKKVVHPLNEIGPRHIEKLEMAHLDTVKPHARHYVQRYARFLTMGESGLKIEDLTNDLVLLALRAMRRYYPFLSGLHMNNTLRRTITNRGRGLITYSVAGLRQRLVPTEEGSYARESGAEFDAACNSASYASDPTNGSRLRIDIDAMAKEGGAISMVAKFIRDENLQERFCEWLEGKVTACVGAKDVSEAVKRSGYEYDFLLSKFLAVPKEEVGAALKRLRELAA